jgi:hypothetical protein
MAKHPNSERREAVCAWLTANGINPKHVPADADMIISEGTGGRFLCCEVFDLTTDGHRQVDEHGTGVAVTVIAMPMKVEPPSWWKPYEKPTRDQLLDVVEQIRKLAPAFEYEATAVGLAEPAREVLRDASRRIRTVLNTLPEKGPL